MSTMSLLLFCSCLAPAQGREELQKEMKRLQGQWTVIRVRRGAADSKEDVLKGSMIVEIQENKLLFGDTMMHPRAERRFSITVHTDPKRIDVIWSPHIKRDSRMEGIYKLENDTFSICLCTSVQQRRRPVRFPVELDDNTIVLDMKRAKP